MIWWNFFQENLCLTELIERNINRFSDSFMFQQTIQETIEVVAICDHLNRLKFSSNFPYVFIKNGAVMVASVLNSDRAISGKIRPTAGESVLNGVMNTEVYFLLKTRRSSWKIPNEINLRCQIDSSSEKVSQNANPYLQLSKMPDDY